MTNKDLIKQYVDTGIKISEYQKIFIKNYQSIIKKYSKNLNQIKL